MIDLKALRENPDRFRAGAKLKNIPADIDRVLDLDARKRAAMTEAETLRAEQKRIEKDLGPRWASCRRPEEGAPGSPEAAQIQTELDALKARPNELKGKIAAAEAVIAELSPQLDTLLLQIPLPPDADVPVASAPRGTKRVRRWAPRA